jgi:OFA family oxalate/formate antiporter-like MFS transporter
MKGIIMRILRNNRYAILVASVFLQFCYGLAYVWSAFQPYVKERFSLDTCSANMPFSVLLAAFSVGNVIGGLMQKRVKALYIVLAGNMMLILGFLLTAYVPMDKGYLLNVTYGILAGFGAGVSYNTTIASVQKWFPEKRGLVTGILICATGSFGLIMNPIAQKALSTYGYESGTLIVTGIIAVCLLIGSGFISKPDTNDVSENSSSNETTETNYSFSEVLKMPQYYLIAFTMMLAVPGYVLINPMLMSMGTDRGLTEATALIGVMIVALMNTSGRLLVPWISDKIGCKKMIMILFVINIIAILLVSVLTYYPFMMAIAAVGFAYGGFMGMYPTITVDYFGSKYNGVNYGGVMIGFGISCLACPYLVKAVQTSSMGLVLSLIIAAGASLLGIALLTVVKKPKAKVDRQGTVNIKTIFN